MYSVSSALRPEFRLRGPAGLFKSIEHHPLCWGILKNCNEDIESCPLDILTFHRKGQTTVEDILSETIDLLNGIYEKYPNLRNLPYENSEADPTSGWWKPHLPYADVSYANELIRIVFQYWNATYSRKLTNLDSISHDNAFMSYYPYEFEQRTLLARFAMNRTNPPHVQFIRKPVHAALGLLASLGYSASSVMSFAKEMECLITRRADTYGAILCISANTNSSRNESEANRYHVIDVIKLGLDVNSVYFIEYLAAELTDPFFIWNKWNRPCYPNRTVYASLRKSEVMYII